MEDDYEFFEDDIEEKIEIDEDIKKVLEESENLITGGGSLGSGELLALKIALQIRGRCILVNSPGEIDSLVTYPKTYIKTPYINPGRSCAPAAAAISKEKKLPVMVFAGDGATRENLRDIIAEGEKNSNILYICYNNQSSGYYVESIANRLLPYSKYTATASISHMGDFIRKLRKACSVEGFRYIEVLTPSPLRWGFDHSITVDVARNGVESRLWPLYESSGMKIKMNSIPTPASPELFIDSQKRFKKIPKEILIEITQRAAKIWSNLS